jgi:YVTN family beta-propeller protein
LINKHSVSCTLILRLLVVTAVALLFSIFLTLERVWADSIKNVAVGNIPASVAFNPSNGYTYVTNVDSNTVSVIDGSTNTVIDTIPCG